MLATNKLTFAGYCLTDKGTHPDQPRVDEENNTKMPRKCHRRRSFVGLVNFCSQFIKGYATVTEPLRQLTRKGEPHYNNIKNNIPECIPEQAQETELDRKDREMKEKMKDKTDKVRKAKVCEIKEGDMALVKNLRKKHKMSPNWLNERFKVIKAYKNSALIENKDKHRFNRKKYI